MKRPVATLALLITAALAFAACGSSFGPGGGGSDGRRAQPLAAIYDSLVNIPGISIPQYLATGLTVDLTLEIGGDGIDASGHFEALISIVEVKVAGSSRPFSADDPLVTTGHTSGVDFAVDSFGPINVGTPSSGFTSVMLSLIGTLSADGRTIQGMAVVTSSAEMGSFSAVKQRRYLVAGTSFGVTGTISLVKVRYNTEFLVDKNLEAVSGDPIVTSSAGGVFVVNRFFFDNIQILDPATDFTTAHQFSTGNGSNPHDALAVDANRIYITRYEPPFNDLLIADRTTGRYLHSIDLTPLASNTSKTPRPDSLAPADGFVFVALQNIDTTFLDYGPGRLAVVNPANDSIRNTIPLSGTNPFGEPALHPDTGMLYYAMAGIFPGSQSQQLSGGIEVVDPFTMTSLGLLVDDDDLGGNVSAVAIERTQTGVSGYCIVTLASGENQVRRFDPETGTISAGIIYQTASFLPALAADGDGYVLVPVGDIAAPRLLVLDAGSGLVVATLPMSLPPFSVSVLTSDFLVN